nr:hypothetical protein BaRGS_010767 [Batillaria attramentaria]
MITNPSPSLPDGNPLLLTAEQFSLALLVMEKLRYVILPLALLVTFVNVTVFADRAMRGATSTYILALSLAQILYLVIEVLYQILQKEMQNPFNSAFFIGYMIYVKTYLAMLVLRRTAYVVACLVSTERLYAILRPLHVKTFCLVRYPKSFLAGAYLLGLVYHLYYPVRLKVVYRGEGVYGVQWTEGYLKNRALVDSVGVSTKIVMTFLPLSVQIVLNVLTITGLRRHTAIRKSMTSAGSSNLPAGDAAVIKSREAEMKRERQMTVTILVVTICYVVLAMPIYVHSLLISLAVPGYNNLFGAKYSRLFSVVQVVSHNCTYLSCFTDFFGFVLLSSAYRKVFVRRFRLTSLVKRFTGGQGKDLGGSELTDTTADR